MTMDPSTEFRVLRNQTGVTLHDICEMCDIGIRCVERWESRNTPRPEVLEYLREVLANDNEYLLEELQRYNESGSKNIKMQLYRGAGHYQACNSGAEKLSWNRVTRWQQRLISLLYLNGYQIDFEYYPPVPKTNADHRTDISPEK